MLRARPTAKAEVLSLEDGQEEPPVALIEVEEEPPAEQSFLWEQIASSLDEVELHEVRRVVGEVLVQSLEDVYAELAQQHLVEIGAALGAISAQRAPAAPLAPLGSPQQPRAAPPQLSFVTSAQRPFRRASGCPAQSDFRPL